MRHTLPNSLTTVTPLSKIIAASLFVILPMIAFGLGYNIALNATKDLKQNRNELPSKLKVRTDEQRKQAAIDSFKEELVSPNASLSAELEDKKIYNYFYITPSVFIVEVADNLSPEPQKQKDYYYVNQGNWFKMTDTPQPCTIEEYHIIDDKLNLPLTSALDGDRLLLISNCAFYDGRNGPFLSLYELETGKKIPFTDPSNLSQRSVTWLKPQVVHESGDIGGVLQENTNGEITFGKEPVIAVGFGHADKEQLVGFGTYSVRTGRLMKLSMFE